MLIGTDTFIFGALMLNILAWATKTCTDPSKFPFVQLNVTLPGFSYVSISTEGITICVVNCLKRKWCKSFNFNLRSGDCELNFATSSHGSINATHLMPATGFVFSDIKHWPQRMAGACANHNCTAGSYCKEIDGIQFRCIGYASSCGKVKECHPSSPDGEYWLRLLNFDLYRTRIYCYNMNTDTPLEYLTLPTPNYGIYPKVGNVLCSAEIGLTGTCTGSGGEVWYNKIRVRIQNMVVVRNDATFANLTNVHLPYAMAKDCYARHDNGVVSSCGTRGEFTVNLTGTGWAVRADQPWIVEGWKSAIESIVRSENGSVVHLKCGGRPGWCHPNGSLTLTVLPTKVVEESSATEVECV
ncbi:A disintegrin and metalloproteinase with thrombospondin motifs 9-like [Haliotis cracherodii]|uniref:A disintegrin and metalloproteinase with thrombospondin motifs 9-like n=1 Tax=Haliotis cracherodii TaxID=6455 RepID=UPI0039EADD05